MDISKDTIKKDVWEGRFSFDTEISKAFRSSDNKIHVFAVASDTQTDLQDDRMSRAALTKMQAQLSRDSIPLLNSHSSAIGFGHSVGAKIQKVGVNTWELEVEFVLDDTFGESKAISRELLSGNTNLQLSIGGKVNKDNEKSISFETDRETNRTIRVLNDVILDHVAATRPNAAANQRTRFIAAIVKSLEGLEDDYSFENWHMKSDELNLKRELTNIELSISKLKNASEEELKKAANEEEEFYKGVVTHKKYPLADRDMAWSFTAEDGDNLLEKGGWALYKAAQTWFDDSDSSVPETKSAYKLPHHKIVDGVVKTVPRGVIAAMAAVRGARGGVSMPSEDRSGVVKHLSSHFREMGLTPPTEKQLDEMKSDQEYADFLLKQGIDTIILEDLMDDLNKDTKSTAAAEELVSNLEKAVEDVKKGFTAEQLNGELGKRMKNLQSAFDELLEVSEEKTEKTEESGLVLNEETIEEIVNRLSKMVAKMQAEVMGKTKELCDPSEGIKKSFDDFSVKVLNKVKGSVDKSAEESKTAIEELSKRLSTVEKVGGLSNTEPTTVKKETVLASSEDPFAGLWSGAVQRFTKK